VAEAAAEPVAEPTPMHLLVAILNAPEKLDSILAGFVALGVKGATVISSQGMGRLLSHDIPIFAGLQTLIDRSRPENRTILTVVSAGASAMTRLGTLPFPTPKFLGLGLIPQGGISLVMALSALLTFYGLELGGVDVSQWLFSVVVLGVVLSELVGPTLTTGTLRRAGEISPLVEKALALGDDESARAEAARHRPAIPDGSDDVSSDDADDVQRGTRTSTS